MTDLDFYEDEPEFEYEYRIGWNATSNVNFEGFTDWEVYEDYCVTPDEIEDFLTNNGSRGAGMPYGLEEALEAAGFDWWVETRLIADGMLPDSDD